MATPPDFSVGQVLTAAQMNAVGLWLVKEQTVGSAVSSVTVSSAFSADYDAYQIIYTGGGGSAYGPLSLQFGAAVAGYYSVTLYAGYPSGAVSVVRDNNAAQFTYVGSQSTTNSFLSCRVFSPFLTKETSIFADYAEQSPTANGGTTSGYLNTATSYTDFKISRASGTMTGGTIRVYGYRN